MQFLDKQDMFVHFKKLIMDKIIANMTHNMVDWEVQAKKYFQQGTAFAILSHRWSTELNFQDMTKISQDGLKAFKQDFLSKWFHHTEVVDKAASANLEHIPGLDKLENFCNLAKHHGCAYAWIDTCCIDKTSSAELEESIRSMFHWYHQAQVCIVHLAASTTVKDLWGDPWFTRGWTLQELLAPKNIIFYDMHWRSLTTGIIVKVHQDPQGFEETRLWEIISNITHISTDDLLHFKPGMKDIRQRLGWASQRQTQRIEDMAYCLIGIFDISLPIAYGEGKAAFYRLQLEIMQHSNDKGLFLWNGEASPYNSMLAVGPECFQKNITVHKSPFSRLLHSTFNLTNNGLHIPLSLQEVKFSHSGSKYSVEVTSRSIEIEGGEIEKDTEHSLKCFSLAILGYTSNFSTSTTHTPIAILLCGYKYGPDTLYKRVPNIDVIRMESLSDSIAEETEDIPAIAIE